MGNQENVLGARRCISWAHKKALQETGSQQMLLSAFLSSVIPFTQNYLSISVTLSQQGLSAQLILKPR